MKKSHILAIGVIAIAIAIMIISAGDASTYVTFGEAYEMAAAGNKNKIHVVGQLKKAETGEVVGIQTGDDQLSFTFVMIDEATREQKVYYNEPMPPDFTRSEQVVVIGAYRGDIFVADKILLKCPSKYQEEDLTVGV